MKVESTMDKPVTIQLVGNKFKRVKITANNAPTCGSLIIWLDTEDFLAEDSPPLMISPNSIKEVL